MCVDFSRAGPKQITARTLTQEILTPEIENVLEPCFSSPSSLEKMFTQENPALPAWSPSELYSPRPTLNVSLILTIYVLHGIRYSVNIFTRPAGSYLRVLNLDLNSDCSQ